MRSRIDDDAKIAQDLGAEADLAPWPRFAALRIRAAARPRMGHGGHARRAVAQIDEDAAPGFLERREGLSNDLAARDDVGDDVGAVQARRHVSAVADLALDEGEMLHRIETASRRRIRSSGPLGAIDVKGLHALDEFFARLAIGDEIGDRDPLQFVLFGKACDLRAGHHRAVVIGEFADHADRRQTRERARDRRRPRYGRSASARRLPWRSAERHGRGARNQPRRHCRWPARGRYCCAARRKCPSSARGATSTETVKAVPCGASFSDTIGCRVEALGVLQRDRRADDAAAIADDEGHLLGRAERGGDRRDRPRSPDRRHP